MERHLFPGANTPRGFVSLFASIPAEDDRTVILKGGPGVGKSTCMLRAAETARNAGLAVEYFHCSSDPDSLDAIRIPASRFIMVDGTAPQEIVRQ